MNWTIELIEPAHFLKVSAQGVFTLEGCIAMKEDFISREYWKTGMNILIDYRQVAFTNINLDIIRKVGEFHQIKNERIGNGRFAFLMKSILDFGFARQYEMVTDSKVLSQIHVFIDEIEAVNWVAEVRTNI